ncbi:MAG: Crp/Fnr family transcriptional regulator [Tepidiformaceae bacterium]
MPLSQYRRLSSEHTTFRELNGPYSHQVLVAMIAQSALCLATHAVEERLARWLLTTADRVGAETFLLTQELLGQMPGVQRPTVSEAGSGLRERQIISYTRGRITIHDRER